MTQQSQQNNDQAKKISIGSFMAGQQQKTGLGDGVPLEARALMTDVKPVVTPEEKKILDSFPPALSGIFICLARHFVFNESPPSIPPGPLPSHHPKSRVGNRQS